MQVNDAGVEFIPTRVLPLLTADARARADELIAWVQVHNPVPSRVQDDESIEDERETLLAQVEELQARVAELEAAAAEAAQLLQSAGMKRSRS